MFRKELVLRLLKESFFIVAENLLSEIEKNFLSIFFDITKEDIYNEKTDEFIKYLVFTKKEKFLEIQY